jgi:hypothetical protein
VAPALLIQRIDSELEYDNKVVQTDHFPQMLDASETHVRSPKMGITNAIEMMQTARSTSTLVVIVTVTADNRFQDPLLNVCRFTPESPD